VCLTRRELLLRSTLLVFVVLFWSCSLLAKAKVRVPYPFAVVLTGSVSLMGQPIDSLAAYAFDGSRWRRVACQVDERNRRGDYVLSEGLPYTSRSDDRLFDRNDEVALWGTDFGAPFTSKQIDKKLREGWKDFWHISLNSDLGYHGDLLIVRERSNNVQNSIKNMVYFDPLKKEITSSEYYYRFKDAKAALLGDLSVNVGGKRLPVIKRSQFTMNFELPWYLPDFSLNDDNFSSEIESWQVGPVRAIVAVGVKFRNFLKMFNFHMFSELVFYQNSFRIPTIVEFPIDPSRHFQLGTGIAYTIDFSDEQHMSFNSNLKYLPANGPKAYIEGGGELADTSPYYYIDGRFGEKLLLMKVEVDPKAAKTSMPPFLIRQQSFVDKNLIKQWPWLDGMSGEVGAFIDISRVHKGSYDFSLDIFLSPEANEKVMSSVDSLRTNWLSTSSQ